VKDEDPSQVEEDRSSCMFISAALDRHQDELTMEQHPQVVEVILKLLNLTNHDLSEALAQIDNWKWPRSDLNAWIPVLNKFDSILEEVIRDYDVGKLQIKAFTPSAKKIVCEILRFERLLLENSTNRKMFNSYDVSNYTTRL
jgi:E3 ubiquitin-protein ligase HUWE1